MIHVLDRPIFTTLATRHAQFAEGGANAKRYRSGTIPFASAANDDPVSVAALGDLVRSGEQLLLLQANAIVLPPTLTAVSTAPGVQMLAEASRVGVVDDDRIEPLGKANAAEMVALAELTKPGPFSLRALELGDFWGIRIEGRLAAMAGQRFRQNGYSEISGVCTHPDFRGKGLARLLSLFVMDRIFAAGERPYLHAYAANTAAIALYEQIGFRLRSPLNVAVVARAD